VSARDPAGDRAPHYRDDAGGESSSRSCRQPSRPPAVFIRLELESTPELIPDVLNEAEHLRLCDWLEHSAEGQLVRLALEMAEQRRAA
jgi:hypothetical protein